MKARRREQYGDEECEVLDTTEGAEQQGGNRQRADADYMK